VNLHIAEQLALRVMAHWGLTARGWRFSFDRAKKRFGSCRHHEKRITLSRPLTEIGSEADVLDTIRHEVAHALAGPRAGHGPKWKAMAEQVGAKPERCGEGPLLRDGNYVAVCPTCGRAYYRYRRPKRGTVYLCRQDRSRISFRPVANRTSAVSAKHVPPSGPQAKPPKP